MEMPAKIQFSCKPGEEKDFWLEPGKALHKPQCSGVWFTVGCSRKLLQKIMLKHTPMGRLGEPSEIARTVAFLTADDAGFITGANIPVNGGYFMSF